MAVCVPEMQQFIEDSAVRVCGRRRANAVSASAERQRSSMKPTKTDETEKKANRGERKSSEFQFPESSFRLSFSHLPSRFRSAECGRSAEVRCNLIEHRIPSLDEHTGASVREREGE